VDRVPAGGGAEWREPVRGTPNIKHKQVSSHRFYNKPIYLNDSCFYLKNK